MYSVVTMRKYILRKELYHYFNTHSESEIENYIAMGTIYPVATTYQIIARIN